MSVHGCNELCDLHDDLHYLQRDLLPMEGHEENRVELLIEALEKDLKRNEEALQILKRL